MAQFNSRSYTNHRGINLMENNGVLRFEVPLQTPVTTSGEYLLYINSSGELIFNNGSSAVTIGAAGGGGGTPTWDGIYASDKTLTIGGGTLTFAGNASDAENVITISNVSGSSGAALQFNNSGSGSDIDGSGDTWSISKTGVAILEELTIDGTEGSNIFTVTKGDSRFLDGAVAITDDDNAASFTVTNDSATSASVIVLAGSGTFTGNTTSSFMTITPSGLTTGTAVYLPLAALTTGKGIHVVANAVTDGLVVNITSSSTVHTATGRLLNVAHTAATNTSAVLNEFSTAANDETVLLRLTASDALAAGKILHLNASSMTTGTAIDAAALDALTTGIGLAIASTSTTLTTGSLARFTTATTGAVATNGVVSIRGTGAHTSTSNVGLLDVQSSGATGTATIVNIKSTAAAQTDTTLLNVEASGFTTGYTGSMLRIKSPTTTGACRVVDLIADGITSGGTAMKISVAALTTGDGLVIDNGTAATTTGSLLKVTAGGTGAVSSDGLVSFQHTGVYTSSTVGFVNILTSGTTAGTTLSVTASATTTGIGTLIATAALTEGTNLRLSAVEATLTTGKYFECYDGAANDFSIAKYGATVIAGNAIGTAALTLTAGDAVLTSGNLILTSGHIKNTPQAIVNANTAISIVTLGTTIANNGASTHTLADGTVGQLKYIVCTVYAGDAVITPANFVGTTITLNAAGDSWLGVFVGTEWVTLALGGTAAVA